MARQRSRGGAASRVRITASPSVVSDGNVTVMAMQSVNLIPGVATYLHVVLHADGGGLHTVPLHLIEAYEKAVAAMHDAQTAIASYVNEHETYPVDTAWAPSFDWVQHAVPIAPPNSAGMDFPQLGDGAPAEPEKEASLLALLEPTGEHPVTVGQRYGTLNGLSDDPDQTRPLPEL